MFGGGCFPKRLRWGAALAISIVMLGSWTFSLNTVRHNLKFGLLSGGQRCVCSSGRSSVVMVAKFQSSVESSINLGTSLPHVCWDRTSAYFEYRVIFRQG